MNEEQLRQRVGDASIRAVARRGIPLSGTDAQALEGALQDAEAEVARLRAALPDPAKLRLLAEWLDATHPSPRTEVQDDLRRWAVAVEKETNV